jgi:hypothetical protein
LENVFNGVERRHRTINLRQRNIPHSHARVVADCFGWIASDKPSGRYP